MLNMFKYYGKLEGATVEKVIATTNERGLFYGLVFSNGYTAWISADEEGNGAGFLEIV